eukprot:scaffold25685_cov78-Phaeocystis_antarctica.AAC.1
MPTNLKLVFGRPPGRVLTNENGGSLPGWSTLSRLYTAGVADTGFLAHVQTELAVKVPREGAGCRMARRAQAMLGPPRQ